MAPPSCGCKHFEKDILDRQVSRSHLVLSARRLRILVGEVPAWGSLTPSSRTKKKCNSAVATAPWTDHEQMNSHRPIVNFMSNWMPSALNCPVAGRNKREYLRPWRMVSGARARWSQNEGIAGNPNWRFAERRAMGKHGAIDWLEFKKFRCFDALK
jgi:hypothetical protein